MDLNFTIDSLEQMEDSLMQELLKSKHSFEQKKIQSNTEQKYIKVLKEKIEDLKQKIDKKEEELNVTRMMGLKKNKMLKNELRIEREKNKNFQREK